MEWWRDNWNNSEALEKEAKREGFQTWSGLENWFSTRKMNINDTKRIEFELVRCGKRTPFGGECWNVKGHQGTCGR
jgi:hypothetical protein